MVSPKSLQARAGQRETVHQCLQLLLGVGRHCCIVRVQHVSDEGFTNLCLGSEAAKIEKPAIWSGPQTKFPLMLCQRRVSRAVQRRFQRASGLGRTLVWPRCGCQRAWRSCRWTALSLLCLCGRIRSCSAMLVDSQSLGGSGRDRLCWQDQTPLSGQWKRYTGASVVLCTSPGVGEGRRPCLLLTFQLGSHTVIQDRHVLPASAVGSRWPLQRLCQWRWEGRCLCSCCSRSSFPCSWRVWWSWRPACLVVQLLYGLWTDSCARCNAFVSFILCLLSFICLFVNHKSFLFNFQSIFLSVILSVGALSVLFACLSTHLFDPCVWFYEQTNKNRPEWRLSATYHAWDTPFWSGTLDYLFIIMFEQPDGSAQQLQSVAEVFLGGQRELLLWGQLRAEGQDWPMRTGPDQGLSAGHLGALLHQCCLRLRLGLRFGHE